MDDWALRGTQKVLSFAQGSLVPYARISGVCTFVALLGTPRFLRQGVGVNQDPSLDLLMRFARGRDPSERT